MFYGSLCLVLAAIRWISCSSSTEQLVVVGTRAAKQSCPVLGAVIQQLFPPLLF